MTTMAMQDWGNALAKKLLDCVWKFQSPDKAIHSDRPMRIWFDRVPKDKGLDVESTGTSLLKLPDLRDVLMAGTAKCGRFDLP